MALVSWSAIRNGDVIYCIAVTLINSYALESFMNIDELNEIGVQVAEWFQNENFESIALEYGYALSFDRKPSDAVKEDFELACNEVQGDIKNSKASVSTKYFENNESSMLALIECDFQLNYSTGVLVELIMKVNGNVYLEQISSY
ncbi:hypothetical protein [Zooshikella ganghwensis]|uniref:hypothetical protein n=1 Tax=Zooshikella ganghwensis TaxID=202772 RepID=UPI0004840714|nr:hypothetical protein [Zooshikella ganghwensis]